MADTKFIKVLDRNGNLLVDFIKGLPGDTKVEEFKKILISNCDRISKYKEFPLNLKNLRKEED